MGFVFAAISLCLYFLFYVLFHELEFIYHHFLVDLAFLPIEVFLVATIFEKLMGRREEEARRERMHMVIGSFFYEIGTDLVRSFATYNHKANKSEYDYNLNQSWTKADFTRFKNNLDKIVPELKVDATQLTELKELLIAKRDYLLRFMENDNLMESEHFSQLLLAVFHLFEELQLRPDLHNLKPGDYAHLSGDVRRTYLLLNEQWIDYLFHIKENTPYLFSLAVRTNPFNPEASVEVK